MKEPNIPSGSFNQKVLIEQQVTAQDPNTGEMTTTWTTFADKVPAAMIPATAREFLMAQQIQAIVTVKCIIRHMDGINPTMRIQHLGQTYNIAGVLHDSTFHRFITLMLSTGVNAG